MLDGELGLFARGEASIWTDPHIGEAMLAAHLDLSHDAASRNGKAIDAAVAWIAGQVLRGGRVLDLVCGPGLYAEKLADLGFAVTGIDCNPASIRHAKERTEGRGSGSPIAWAATSRSPWRALRRGDHDLLRLRSPRPRRALLPSRAAP